MPLRGPAPTVAGHQHAQKPRASRTRDETSENHLMVYNVGTYYTGRGHVRACLDELDAPGVSKTRQTQLPSCVERVRSLVKGEHRILFPASAAKVVCNLWREAEAAAGRCWSRRRAGFQCGGLRAPSLHYVTAIVDIPPPPSDRADLRASLRSRCARRSCCCRCCPAQRCIASSILRRSTKR
jgi:hypothetical protein